MLKNNMERVIIAITSLKRENWIVIYRFIRSIVCSLKYGDEQQECFTLLHGIATLKLNYGISIGDPDDIVVPYGEELEKGHLSKLQPSTCFSIIYQKTTDAEDITELVPFFLLNREFGEAVTLGIDIDDMSLESQQSYKFKTSEFLILFDERKPRCGSRTIYLINEKKIDKQKGELVYTAQMRATSLAGKGLNSAKRYYGERSRRFLPLMLITESNYYSIFGSDTDETNDIREFSYLKESVEKIKGLPELTKLIGRSSMDSWSQTESLFGQWLLAGFLYSHSKNEIKEFTTERLAGIQKTMHLYENSVFELVQNIMFHGGKRGLFYCVFDKKKNMNSNYASKILNFSNYSEETRFLRIGIFDFHDKGIVDTYINNIDNRKGVEGLGIKDFFDVGSIATAGLTSLDLRYAARLGIKTFVKTIINQGGYFRVESNVTEAGNKRKQFLQTYVSCNETRLSSEEYVDFADGTHYEIILPIVPQVSEPIKSIPIQRISMLNRWYLSQQQRFPLERQTIESFQFPGKELENIKRSRTKGEQKERILALSKQMAKQYNSFGHGGVALDMNGMQYDPSLVFKIIACLQLHAGQGYDRIYLVNVDDSFVDDFYALLTPIIEYGNGVNVWSRSSAIILVSLNLHVKIIWGKKKEELLNINNEIQRFYCNYFFAPSKKEVEHISDECLNENLKKISKDLILPYDVIITTKRGKTLFEEFLIRLLKHKVISPDPGCLVNHKNTYIGSKIIVKDFYEADMLFQNNFFIERFAYLICPNIRTALDKKRANGKEKKKKLILIGYQHYSEYLLKSVRRLLEEETINIVLANENRDVSGTECYFDFTVDSSNSGTKDGLLSNSDEYQFVVIVPIGSTLSTNDKVIALFKQWYEHEQQKHHHSGDEYMHLSDSQFVYNHCVIIVRDSQDSETTTLEQEQKWKADGLSITNRIIETHYNCAPCVHYNILVASSIPGNNNWARRLNREISFPCDWWDESYVNYTENASINSQNLMGFPKADICDEQSHTEELKRIYEFRDVICKGHIDVLGSHHRYYIDTESFAKQNNNGLKNWLVQLCEQGDNKTVFNSDKLNVIITPNADRESDYVRLVNDILFDGSAMIVFLDVRNWRNNIVYKLSYLRDISPGHVRYHYVDHALLTGSSYYMAKSYLFSILGYKNVDFTSIITIVNRLSFAKAKEVKQDVNGHFYAYANLLYPSNDSIQGCDLCKLTAYYNKLLSRTVLESCAAVIKKNQDKLIIDKVDKGSVKPRQFNRRNCLRLLITHELYYRIAEAVKIAEEKKVNFEIVSQKVEETLDVIYAQLTVGHMDHITSYEENTLNQLIDEWYGRSTFTYEGGIGEYLGERLDVDKKISFLKVISSPPLSQYIAIRKYAYKKLLSELHKVINKPKEECEYSDLRTVKAILKSLSFLKSNALVRKEVIVGAWTLLSNVINNIYNERKRLNALLLKLSNKRTNLEWRIKKEKASSERSLFNTDIDILEKQMSVLLLLREEITNDLLKISDESEIIYYFSRDLQFYVKNAIVDDEAKATFLGELLRKGDEMTEFSKVQISATSLYLDTGNKRDKRINDTSTAQEVENDLFSKRFNTDNTLLNEEYVNFLVWLFYDNTTIIRRTLDNFSLELDKNDRCKYLFYDEKGVLRSIKDFKSNINSAKLFFSERIEEEYYYHTFRPYLNNGDKIDFVEKMVYVIYAKLKLEDLTSHHHKTLIETDTHDLMEVFAAIMGADKAFWVMNKSEEKSAEKPRHRRETRRLYPISLYGKGKNFYDDTWDYDKWFLNENYYTGKIHIYKQYKEIVSPVMPLFNISDEMGERKHLGARSAGVFVISRSDQKLKDVKQSFNVAMRGSVVATITFLYDDNNPVVSDEETFRIRLQESSRLMLLLKNIIDSYVIGYLLNDKAFDIWESNFWQVRRFEKIYANSAHRFNAVYEEMDEFDRLDISVIQKMYNTWFFLSNETISFIYSNIERNVEITEKVHHMNLRNQYVIDYDNTIGATFDNRFIAILESLLNSTRWNNGVEDRNQIIINGQELEYFELDEELSLTPLLCNKHLVRTIVAQCIHNSLASVSRHGHRGEGEVKKVEIQIEKSKIYIEDIPLKPYYDDDAKRYREIQFRRKKKMIRSMNCEEYSSTTLTSLQGIVYYMQKNGWNYDCDFGFNHSGNFYVEIKFM